jgi:hypothetical protein
LKRLIVVFEAMATPPIAKVWCEPADRRAKLPDRAPDLEITGDDTAGQLYWAGIRHDVAELCVDVSGMGYILNRQLMDMKYPRMYRERMYQAEGWIRTARTEAAE